MDANVLDLVAQRVRKHIIGMAVNGGCFIGASCSCADIMVYLYSKFLHVLPENPDDPERDYFFLSKGHAVPALYGTLAELGWFEKERLQEHIQPDDYIYLHPNTHIPGVEFHSGSLGHALPLAVGVALDCRIRGTGNRVIVMVGDGELNEGSNWEALMVASAKKLDNLVVIVDRNRFQANMRTEELIPLEPLETKFESFGASVQQGDGHSFTWLDDTFSRIPFTTGLPSIIIAETVRGKGIPSIESRADRWFAVATPEQAEKWRSELDQGSNG